MQLPATPRFQQGRAPARSIKGSAAAAVGWETPGRSAHAVRPLQVRDTSAALAVIASPGASALTLLHTWLIDSICNDSSQGMVLNSKSTFSHSVEFIALQPGLEQSERHFDFAAAPVSRRFVTATTDDCNSGRVTPLYCYCTSHPLHAPVLRVASKERDVQRGQAGRDHRGQRLLAGL